MSAGPEHQIHSQSTYLLVGRGQIFTIQCECICLMLPVISVPSEHLFISAGVICCD